MNKILAKKILKLHPYAITPPSNEKGRWSTYYQSSQGRKKIQKKNEQDLMEFLYELYKYKLDLSPTLKDFYPQWLVHKKLYTLSNETLRRHQQHWNKYYIQSTIINIPLTQITKLDIEEFIHSSIKEFSLTNKELNNMLIILKGSLELAYDKGIITNNPYRHIKVNKKLCRHVTKKSNKTQIFFENEIEKLFMAIDNELAENENCGSCLAIKFLFQTGLRISELCGLMEADIENDTIHICRMEAKHADFNIDDCSFSRTTYEIEGHTKNNNSCGDRIIPLTLEAQNIIQEAKKINDRLNYHTFLFNDDTGRVTTRKVTYRLRKLCKKANIENKTTHSIRRTTASHMATNGVPLDFIRYYLGHNCFETTLSYVFNPLDDEYTISLLNKALCRQK